MRGYFVGRVLGIEVGDKPREDGAYFVTVSFFPEGSRVVHNLWCSTADEVWRQIESMEVSGAPMVGVTAVVSAKAGYNDGPARLSVRLEVLYPLEVGAEEAPATSKSTAKATANGTA